MGPELAHHALSLSVAAFAGYAFTRISHFRRYKTEHLRADRFALHIVGYTALVATAGALITENIPPWGPTWANTILADVDFVGITPTTFNAVIFAIVLGFLDNVKTFVSMRKDPAVKSAKWNARMRMAAVSKYVRRSNDAFLRTLFRAVILRKDVMITLKNNKVYIGNPTYQPDEDPSKKISSLRLIPKASGSRDNVTLEVGLSTLYIHLYNSLKPVDAGTQEDKNAADIFLTSRFLLKQGNKEKEIDLEDIGIVIPFSEVQSLTIFDGHVYNWFYEHRNDEASSNDEQDQTG